VTDIRNKSGYFEGLKGSNCSHCSIIILSYSRIRFYLHHSTYAMPKHHNILFFLIKILCFTLLFSCSSNPENITPNFELPDKFLNDGASKPDSISSPLMDKWWESLNDEMLNLLIEQGLSSNFNLKMAWDRLRQANANLTIEGAPLSPSIDLSNDNRRAEFRDFFGDQVRTNWRTIYNVRFTASYEIDLWGRLRSAKNAAEMSFKASEQEVATAAITLSSEITNTWYQIVEITNQIKLLKYQVEINQNTLQLIKLRFMNGQISISDILRQKQLIESLNGEEEVLKGELRIAKNQLAVLRGYAPQKDPIWITAENNELEKILSTSLDKIMPPPPLPEIGIPAQLITKRPDIQSAFYSVREADYRLASAIADRFPRISISGGAGTTTTTSREMLDDWLINLASNIIAPVFDAGFRAAEVDRNKAVLSERLNLYSQRVLNSVVEVENALSRENQQEKILFNFLSQLEIANKVLSLVKARYTKGLVEYLDVLTATASVQNLQRSILTARRELLNHRVALHRALAGKWELEPSKLESITDPVDKLASSEIQN